MLPGGASPHHKPPNGAEDDASAPRLLGERAHKPATRVPMTPGPWPWLILLAASCTASPAKPDPVSPRHSSDSGSPDSRESGLPDSVACDACALAAQVASTISVDLACSRADLEVADPYDIEIKEELQVNPAWWDGYGAYARPLVADMDGDGVPELAINECSQDLVECEFSVFASDGSVVMDAPGSMGFFSPLAAVDLDGTPGAEVLRVFRDSDAVSYIVAQRYDGGVLWRVEEDVFSIQYLTVADLLGDGTPEILTNGVILDAQTGVEVGSYERNDGGGDVIATADVDHDGQLEFAEAGRLFASDGSTVWTLPGDAGVGGIAVAMQADADREPEFLFVTEGFVIADTDGTILTQVDAPMQNPKYSAVADLDGDGSPEIVIVTSSFVVAAYRLDGTLFWERDDLGYVEDITAWDVDGDGASELLVSELRGVDGGRNAFKILSGVKGDVLFSTPHLTHFGGQPFVADIDNDGHAEIIMAGGAYREGPSPSVTIYHQVNDTWPAAGPAWPVPDYHLTNIGPAGEIPVVEPDPAPWTYNLFHARPAVDGQPANLTPTLVQSCSDTCEEGGSVQIEVRVTNSGPADANEVLLRVTAGGTTVTETTLPQVGSGVMSAGVILTIPGTSFDLGEVRVVVDPNGSNAECEEGDNELVVADPR